MELDTRHHDSFSDWSVPSRGSASSRLSLGCRSTGWSGVHFAVYIGSILIFLGRYLMVRMF